MSVLPGVKAREIDLSLYAQQLSSAILGMPGLFTKGPINVRTHLASEDALTATFGKPTQDAQGWYAAREFLRQGNQLEVVRVESAATPATLATINLLDSGSVASIQLDSINEGSGWNGYTIFVTAGTSTGAKLTIEDPDGVVVEVFDNVLRSNAVAVLNGISKVVVATILTVGSPGEPTYPATRVLAGGTDGIAGLFDSDVIGTSTPTSRTGLKLFKNPEAVDINLLAAPGFVGAPTILEMFSIAATRGDTLALADPPFGLNYQEVRDWHNGVAPFNDHTAFNTSYGATYWSWQEVYDEYNKERVWTAPSGHVARVMAYNDAVKAPWWAPAGFTRGVLTSALASEYSPDVDEREYIAGDGQNINPIVNFEGFGLVVYGQKTLQRIPSALDRINVRRMLLALRKVVATAIRYLSFEPSDPTTWRQFKGLVEPPIRTIITGRGINQARVVCDATTNTKEVRDQNRLAGKIFLEPTKSAEQIEVDFILTPQGANFDESLVTGT